MIRRLSLATLESLRQRALLARDVSPSATVHVDRDDLLAMLDELQLYRVGAATLEAIRQ